MGVVRGSYRLPARINVPRSQKMRHMGRRGKHYDPPIRTQPDWPGYWWKTFTASALGLTTALTAATVPLYFALQNDRDLQRTELGIAELHTAYTEFINAADAVIIPIYISWGDVYQAGGENNVSREKNDEIADLFPDWSEDAVRFQDAATRLRLVIPADDARLVSRLEDSLGSSIFTSPEAVPIPPDDLLRNYTDAKFSLVNEFRTDVLGQDALGGTEVFQMFERTNLNIWQEFLFRSTNPAEEIYGG